MTCYGTVLTLHCSQGEPDPPASAQQETAPPPPVVEAREEKKVLSSLSPAEVGKGVRGKVNRVCCKSIDSYTHTQRMAMRAKRFGENTSNQAKKLARAQR